MMSNLPLSLRLSDEANQIIKENCLEEVMIKKFSEADIDDLFRGCKFMDRFNLRQFIAANKEGSKQLLPVATSANTAEMKSNEKESETFLNTFSPSELLNKKKIREKATPSQQLFSSLIKDCAKGAHIWKKAPLLSEIPTRKREMFFEMLYSKAPQLKGRDSEIWKRLGDNLQNRRKYLRDIDNGKRKRSLKFATATLPVPVEKTSQIFKFTPGEPVHILNKDKKTIGEGVFMKATNQIFCEIVVRSVKLSLSENEELPQPIDDIQFLNEKTLKRVVLWRLDRMSTGAKNAADKDLGIPRPVAPTKKYGHGEEKIVARPITNSKKSSTITSSYLPSKLSSQSVSQHKPITYSRKNDSPAKLSSQKSNKPHILKPNTDLRKTASPVKTAKSVAVYEWSQRKLFIGLESEKGIQNCKKPIEAITHHQTLELFEMDSLTTTLNPKDFQLNPDSDYRVMMCAGGVAQERDGHIHLDDPITFKTNLLQCFKEYIAL